MKLSLVVLLTIVATGCGGYGSMYRAPGAMTVASSISALSPGNTGAGAPSFTLTVNGNGFNANSMVFFNGVAQPTTFVSAAQITAMISAAEVAMTGTMPVYVRVSSGGGMYGPVSQNSNTVNFAVN
jgi:IPT/TIG domain